MSLTVTLSDGREQLSTYTYDALNRLETVSNETGVTSYGYDAAGNRTSVSQH
ncbi:MAG: RHS repeat protein [Gammaproteobacteria bacterium]